MRAWEPQVKAQAQGGFAQTGAYTEAYQVEAAALPSLSVYFASYCLRSPTSRGRPFPRVPGLRFVRWNRCSTQASAPELFCSSGVGKCRRRGLGASHRRLVTRALPRVCTRASGCRKAHVRTECDLTKRCRELLQRSGRATRSFLCLFSWEPRPGSPRESIARPPRTNQLGRASLRHTCHYHNNHGSLYSDMLYVAFVFLLS